MNTVRANDTLMAIVEPLEEGDAVEIAKGWVGVIESIDRVNQIAHVVGIAREGDALDSDDADLFDNKYALSDLIRADYEQKWAA